MEWAVNMPISLLRDTLINLSSKVRYFLWWICSIINKADHKHWILCWRIVWMMSTFPIKHGMIISMAFHRKKSMLSSTDQVSPTLIISMALLPRPSDHFATSQQNYLDNSQPQISKILSQKKSWYTQRSILRSNSKKRRVENSSNLYRRLTNLIHKPLPMLLRRLSRTMISLRLT